MMRIFHNLGKLWPFTIKFYALSFIILMSLVFGLLGWGMQYKLDRIRAEALSNNSKAAAEELHDVIGHVIEAIKQRAQSIASQDETRQQFFNRDYYTYWRDNRILGSGVLPAFLQAVELYNAQGQTLAQHTIDGMPKKISRQDMKNFVTRHNDQYFLFAFYPVAAASNSQGPAIGYIGFKLDFLNALKNEQRYSFININDFKLKIAEAEHVPLDEIFSRMEFTLIPNTESMALAASIERFQRQILFTMIVLYFLFYMMLSSVLSAPLRRLSLHIDTLRKGKGGLLAHNYTRSLPVAELEKVRISLNDYQNKLEEMHHSLSEKNDELWQLAHHDPLTGIYNRRGFEEDWKHVLSVSSGHRMGVALLLFDCDHFKAINDTYGHPTGDQVIQAITQTLQETLRHGDRLYRLGGDEFATMFLDVDATLVLNTAERCIEAISKYDFAKFGIKEPVRISAGMAFSTGIDVEQLNSLPKQADVAMYYAKRPGKNKIAVFDRSMSDNTDVLFSNSINSLVYKAMASDETIEMHYQPITNLETGEAVYYEALLRIRDGDNLIMPSTIFPIIQERRIEAEFDFVILGKIAKDIEAGKIPAGKGITVNVSGPGLLDPLVLEKINSLAVYLKQYTLIIEVTETALITQLQLASSILNKLRQTGFKIALDDFGSGYSSLSYLSNMPVDCVKFDVSLIRQLFEDNRQSIIIENLATMVVKAGYDLVAEGVETEEILQRIVKLGFKRGQGFLFGRPESKCMESAKIPYFDNIIQIHSV
jgi:diguanylate cyclase (GGDEF)-like protein